MKLTYARLDKIKAWRGAFMSLESYSLKLTDELIAHAEATLDIPADEIVRKIRNEWEDDLSQKATLDDGWIDVHSRPLPNGGATVAQFLTFDTTSNEVLINSICFGNWSRNDSTVTHWRPLPKGPTK